MIKTKKELDDYLKNEKKYYIKSKKGFLVDWLTSEPKLKIWKYQKLLRKTEYCYNNKQKNIVYSILYLYYRRKKNRLGLKLGIEMWENTFDKGLCIHHSGYIVINGKVRVGKNCKLVGGNCIGLKNNCVPVIGDNVVFRFGSSAFGDIVIESNCIIGANAVVVDNVQSKSVMGGVPAKLIKIL